jgi:MSHA biogenesis protein MshK
MAGGLDMSPRGQLLVGAALAMLAMLANAQSLADPTRPPAGYDVGPANVGVPVQPARMSLQTIVRRADGQRAAVVDGQLFVLGGRIGDAKLIRIGEDSIDLQTLTGRETLQLTPGIDKRPTAMDDGVAKRPKTAKFRERRGTDEAKP